MHFRVRPKFTGVDNIVPTADDYWAYVHREISVSKADGSVLGLLSCTKLVVDTDDGK